MCGANMQRDYFLNSICLATTDLLDVLANNATLKALEELQVIAWRTRKTQPVASKAFPKYTTF